MLNSSSAMMTLLISAIFRSTTHVALFVSKFLYQRCLHSDHGCQPVPCPCYGGNANGHKLQLLLQPLRLSFQNSIPNFAINSLHNPFTLPISNFTSKT